MTAPDFGSSFVMVDPQHVADVGPSAAILFARICWRSQETGCWAASRAALSEETGLTLEMIRTAVRVLRDREWVTSYRSSPMDATLVWRPVFAGHPDGGGSPTPRGESPTCSDGDTPTSQVGDSPGFSLETEDVNTPLPPGEDGGLFQEPVKPSKPKRRAERLPADYRPQPSHFDLARDLGVDLSLEGPKFVDYHTAKGSTMKDWDAALRTWIRNAATYRGNVRPLRPAADPTWGAGDAVLPAPPKRDLYG